MNIRFISAPSVRVTSTIWPAYSGAERGTIHETASHIDRCGGVSPQSRIRPTLLKPARPARDQTATPRRLAGAMHHKDVQSSNCVATNVRLIPTHSSRGRAGRHVERGRYRHCRPGSARPVERLPKNRNSKRCRRVVNGLRRQYSAATGPSIVERHPPTDGSWQRGSATSRRPRPSIAGITGLASLIAARVHRDTVQPNEIIRNPADGLRIQAQSQHSWSELSVELP
jgi:hypothetical protein